MVVDAGGLTRDVKCRAILTPHRGEFQRLFDVEANEENAMKVAKSHGLTLIVKGMEDVITDGERVKVNRTGNAGMTVGGTGDVLAGVAGAIFAINDDPFKAGVASAFITGFAGDMCFEEKGYTFTALDVVKKLPYAIKKVNELK